MSNYWVFDFFLKAGCLFSSVTSPRSLLMSILNVFVLIFNLSDGLFDHNYMWHCVVEAKIFSILLKIKLQKGRYTMFEEDLNTKK